MHVQTKLPTKRPFPRILGHILAGAVLTLVCTSAFAWGVPQTPNDFITGGGWILRASGAKANFGVGGGVKNGAWWGHLEYIDHGTGLNVHGTQVTGYLYVDTHTRDICGFADTNLYGPVAYHVRVADNDNGGEGRPTSTKDTFIIRLGQNGVVVYTTEGDASHELGGGGPGGGDIQLHKGNASNTAPSTLPVCNI